jgi:hypothetical protein
LPAISSPDLQGGVSGVELHFARGIGKIRELGPLSWKS